MELLIVGLIVAAGFARVGAILKGVAIGAAFMVVTGLGACVGVATAEDCGIYRTRLGQDLCMQANAREQERLARERIRIEAAEDRSRLKYESHTGTLSAKLAIVNRELLAGGLGETNIRPVLRKTAAEQARCDAEQAKRGELVMQCSMDRINRGLKPNCPDFSAMPLPACEAEGTDDSELEAMRLQAGVR